MIYGQHIACWGHTRPITEISFVQDGPNKTLLISSAHDKHPQVRHGENGDWVGSFHGHKGAVWSCKADRRTRTLSATASGDFSAKLWCLTTGKELCELGKHRHVVKTVDFSNDSLYIATGCQDGYVRLFDTCNPSITEREIRVAAGPDDAVTKLWWNQDGNEGCITLGKKNGTVEMRDLRTDAASACVEMVASKDAQPITDLKLHPEHQCTLAAAGDKIIKMHSDTLQIIDTIQMPKGMTFEKEGGVSLSPDGTRIMAGASDLDLREFDAQTGSVLRTLKGHHGPIRCVQYHPLGSIVASGSEDATIRMWGLQEE